MLRANMFLKVCGIYNLMMIGVWEMAGVCMYMYVVDVMLDYIVIGYASNLRIKMSVLI
jgi:hypothetical protein